MSHRVDPDDLPRDPESQAPLSPRAQPGYYPGQQSLRQRAFWDAATRATVLERVEKVPVLRFFQPPHDALYAALFARLLPQTDRDEAHQIPILPRVDARLWEGKSDGYRFEDMPADPEAYRLGAEALETAATHAGASGFAALPATQQEELLEQLQQGKPLPGAPDVWKRMSPRRFFLLLLNDAVDAYYAHPFAWDEIGFGGPAYPRGYLRLEHGQPEAWEAAEQRYAWEAPAASRSDVFKNQDTPDGNANAPGQGGTH